MLRVMLGEGGLFAGPDKVNNNALIFDEVNIRARRCKRNMFIIISTGDGDGGGLCACV